MERYGNAVWMKRESDRREEVKIDNEKMRESERERQRKSKNDLQLAFRQIVSNKILRTKTHYERKNTNRE